jgi:hypothetical protein
MYLTTLHEQLASVQGAALRQRLLSRLAEFEKALRAPLATPMPPTAYEKQSAAASAALAAYQVLQAWPVGASPGLRGPL